MILNNRAVHFQDSMQAVLENYARTLPKSSRIQLKMEPRRFLTLEGSIWRAREAQMGALEWLGGQILDTFVKSESWLRRFGCVFERRWRVQERPRELERDAAQVQNLVEKGVRHGFKT